MQLNVTFTEIENLIKQKAQRDIHLSAIDRRTIGVSTDISIPLVGTKEVKVQLTLEEINNEYALLFYNNGIGVDLAIKGVLKFIEMQSNVSYVQGLPNNRIKIQLNKIPKLQSVLKTIEVQNLSFMTSNMELNFKLK